MFIKKAIALNLAQIFLANRTKPDQPVSDLKLKTVFYPANQFMHSYCVLGRNCK